MRLIAMKLLQLGGLSTLLVSLHINAATVVSVEMPEQARMIQEIRLSGSLRARQQASISVRVDGLVQKTNFEAGDWVKKGDILLELDPAMENYALRRARAARLEAEARLKEAKRLVSEAERLIDKRHISQTELETRQSELSFATAALLEAQAAEQSQQELVERHQVPAPFEGFVISRDTEAGEWVTRGTAVYEITNPRQVWLDLQAPQEYFDLTLRASEILIYPDSQPGKEIKGKIVTQVPASNSDARTYLLRVAAINPAEQLLPGTSATAVIQVPSRENTLIIPRDALVRQADGNYSVFAIETDGKQSIAHRLPVTLGKRANGRVEVLDGLSPELPVVTRGNEVLRDGEVVIVEHFVVETK